MHLHLCLAAAAGALLRRTIPLALLSPVLALAQLVAEPAQPVERTWHFGGYGTLGVVHTNIDQPWLYARDEMQYGAGSETSAAVDSRLGLQLNWSPNARWEGVVQGVYKQRATGSRADEAIEWGFLAYRPTPAWTIRVGRTNTDVYLEADVRNLGFAMPWVRPNVEFYGWMPFSSINGADAAYQWQTDQADWKAKVSAGQIHASVQGLRYDSHVGADGLDTIALTISREAGGLTLKASALQTRAVLHFAPQWSQLQQALDMVSNLPVPAVAASAQNLNQALMAGGISRYAGLGAQYDSGPWLLHAELCRVHLERGLSGGTHGYVSAGHRWGRTLGYVMAGVSRPDKASVTMGSDWATQLAPVIGPAGAHSVAMVGLTAEQAAAASRFDQQSVSLGMRWDATDKSALKLQVDSVQVNPAGASNWRHGSADAAHATVVSAVFDWVF